jgi:hypothetical protein
MTSVQRHRKWPIYSIPKRAGKAFVCRASRPSQRSSQTNGRHSRSCTNKKARWPEPLCFLCFCPSYRYRYRLTVRTVRSKAQALLFFLFVVRSAKPNTFLLANLFKHSLSQKLTSLNMSDTPNWLAPGNDAPAPASSSLEVSGTSAPAATQDSGAAATDDDKDLPGIILMMRLTNMGMAGGIITAAVRDWVSCLQHFFALCCILMNGLLTKICSFIYLAIETIYFYTRTYRSFH